METRRYRQLASIYCQRPRNVQGGFAYLARLYLLHTNYDATRIWIQKFNEESFRTLGQQTVSLSKDQLAFPIAAMIAEALFQRCCAPEGCRSYGNDAACVSCQRTVLLAPSGIDFEIGPTTARSYKSAAKKTIPCGDFKRSVWKLALIDGPSIVAHIIASGGQAKITRHDVNNTLSEPRLKVLITLLSFYY